MVNKYSLDEKLKLEERAIFLNRIENARQFIKYFVKLMENILNYSYDELSSYFEEDKTKVEIRIVEKQYRMVVGMENCYISACVRLHREDFSCPKLKVVELKAVDNSLNYIINIDQFIHGSIEDEIFITDYLKFIKSRIFKDFKYDWSYNKDKIFKCYIKDKKFTPSQYIICCINNYIYDDIIKPKCKSITYDEFLNSEFKLEIDKKTQRIFNRYFFENIPSIKKENNWCIFINLNILNQYDNMDYEITLDNGIVKTIGDTEYIFPENDE